MTGPSRLGWKVRRMAMKGVLSGREVNFENLFQNDNVAVFPRLGVLLNRIKKSGNPKLLAFLDDIERVQSTDATEMETSVELKSGRRVHMTALGDILRMRSFSTLVTVRNPYYRAISGFLDKIAKGTNPRYEDYPFFGEDGPEVFESFLDQCGQQNFFGNRHFFPQTALLFQPAERYTKIARVESLPEDMADFMSRIGQDPDAAQALRKPHALEAKEEGKIQNSTEKSHYLTPGARRLIEEMYARDFDVLGYDRLPDS